MFICIYTENILFLIGEIEIWVERRKIISEINPPIDFFLIFKWDTINGH